MPEYYEEEEQAEKYEIKGVTDKVTKSTVEETTYPLVHIIVDSGIPKYKIEALKRLLKSRVKNEAIKDDIATDDSIYIALRANGVTKTIGRIMPQQVKTLMSILTGVDIELELEKGKFMDSKYVYALSS